ncbi:hypothetical protein [Paracoccus sp. SCSIO 75233]|uniref:hypothetical protein n=1 Tax=Paracoccus sp. SCSIO 75233 TaxID=3017782 RepID=UPI0022F032AC|nr:hypothetical protein [Paracoccus sp. SCSIO 75233]WBU53277.1 hypothetical protein PAF12_00075 [Paracoccus sp. SCSIO 75233]
MKMEISVKSYPSSGAINDRLEQAFLEGMIKYAMPAGTVGLGSASGESAFQSYLHREYAKVLGSRLELGFEK